MDMVFLRQEVINQFNTQMQWQSFIHSCMEENVEIMGEHAKFKQNGTSMFEPWTIWLDWANSDNGRYDYQKKKTKQTLCQRLPPFCLYLTMGDGREVVKPKYDMLYMF